MMNIAVDNAWRTFRRIARVCIVAWLAACGDAPTLQLATPDAALFVDEVYPVLLRDCGFHACHGSNERFFQVFGPGRGRLLADTKPLDPVTQAELDHSYERARSMIDAAAPTGSLLLRKPLAASAGGTGHQGSDVWGRNVYDDATQPGYVTLTRWVQSTVPSL
ncbi:MAG: hypothetical protein ABW321_10685 [Polyangiales bacterium]